MLFVLPPQKRRVLDMLLSNVCFTHLSCLSRDWIICYMDAEPPQPQTMPVYVFSFIQLEELKVGSHCRRRTGKYHDAVLSNVHAYNADLVLGQHCMQPYEPEHNTDMLIFAASLGGEVRPVLHLPIHSTAVRPRFPTCCGQA